MASKSSSRAEQKTSGVATFSGSCSPVGIVDLDRKLLLTEVQVLQLLPLEQLRETQEDTHKKNAYKETHTHTHTHRKRALGSAGTKHEMCGLINSCLKTNTHILQFYITTLA